MCMVFCAPTLILDVQDPMLFCGDDFSTVWRPGNIAHVVFDAVGNVGSTAAFPNAYSCLMGYY